MEIRPAAGGTGPGMIRGSFDSQPLRNREGAIALRMTKVGK